MRNLIRAALVVLVLVPAATVLAAHSGGGGSHGGGSSHSGGSHSGGSHGGGSHSGGFHGGSFHGSFGHGWRSGGRFRGGRGFVVFGDPFFWGPWGPWGWWGWGCPFFPDCYGPAYPVARGDDATTREDKQSTWGMVDVDIWPETARVYLDGRYIGAAQNFDGSKDYLYLKPGDYTMEFRQRGYEAASIDVNVDAGAKIELNRKLHRKPGSPQVNSVIPPEPEGGVHRYWGKDGGKLVPYTGEELRARNRYDDDEANDDDDDGDSAPSHSDDMSAKLKLAVEPRDAVLYLDDHFIGTAAEVGRTSGGIEVSPGAHKLTASRPGFKSQTINVEVSENGSKDVELSLEK